MNAFPRSSLDHVGPIVPTWGQSASTLLQNNPGMSDYFLLPAWVPNGFTDEALGWFTMGESGHGLAYGVGSFDGGSTHGQGVVPSTAAWSPSLQQDDGLLRIFVRTLAPFHAALDGVAVPSHPYLKHYVPFIMQSPLLRQTSIYTSAGFLRDQGHMDETTMLSYKVKAIGLFNSHFSTQTGPNDEIIAAHIQLTLIEWYWSNNGKLDPHLRILGELIRPRGGLQSLGLQCLIAKMAVTLDTCISLTTSASPILRSISLTKPPSSRGTTGLCFNTPFVSSFPSFGACVETMNLAPATAKVLDELRFLISAVLALSTQATEMELAKIRVTGSYVYQCILRLGHTSSNQTQGKLPASSHSYPTHHPSNQINDPTTASILPNTMSTDVGGLHPGTTGMVGRRPGVQRSTSSPIVTLSHTTKSGRASSEQQFQQGTAMPPPNPTSFPAQQPVADPLFPAIRLAGLVYARAISNRQSFQSILTEGDLTSLWQAFWRVPLSRWKEVLGVCNWILVPFLPIARNTKQGRVIKNLVFNGLFTMGVEDWEVATSVMERMEGLRVWLAGGGPG
ncbi:hypothetical protein DL546_008275 [Coniochaeta pulveracea]|nr:hypothetical protein DL546_008275 [Coniochaeta pulveracea]